MTIIPQTFDDWRDCIENKCKIKLSHDFIVRRINELSDETNSETILFAQRHGLDHKNNVLSWYKELI